MQLRKGEKHWAATSIAIEQSGLSKKLKTLLKSAGINTIYELAQNYPEELTSTIRGFGWKSISPVQEELARHGWHWGGGRIEEKVKRKKRH
jgi:DNA-directed RNA polymerase alpha subunit